MTIEGFRDFEAVRDFLYSRMRGARQGAHAAALPERGADTPRLAAPAESTTEVAAALREVARELRAVREALSAGPGRGGEG
jgi:putative membrane protein